ncbi:MAG: Wzz/FepE/Etk N-terminal domain-containing protein [Arcobacteraceae bacterium]
MNIEEKNKYLEEDEIDLRELFKTIWDKKVFIILVTLIITVLAGVYAYSKTPIYEAKALIEIGDYTTTTRNGIGDNQLTQSTKVIIDDASQLEKKLNAIFIDMLKNDNNKGSGITSITVSKGMKNYLEIKSEAISNDDAKKEIEKVLFFIQANHTKILDDIKKQKELELKNIDLQISDIKLRTVSMIDRKIENDTQTLKDLAEQLQLINENLKSIQSLNPSLAALKLMEKRDITSELNNINIQLFELESKKDELLTTTIYKLEENRKILELQLLPHNYKNTQIVGEIILNDYPVKPKKSLIIVVAFVTGFILSIFIVFFLQFIRKI